MVKSDFMTLLRYDLKQFTTTSEREGMLKDDGTLPLRLCDASNAFLQHSLTMIQKLIY